MYLIGLDLGQAADYTALAIARRRGEGDAAAYELPWLERYPLGTGYPAIVQAVTARVAQLAEQEPAALRALVVDHTGVGRAVWDLLVRARPPASLVAVTITGGDRATREGDLWRVPKRDLVGAAQVLLQGRRLRVAAALPEAGALTQELLNFRVTITASAHDTYAAWREGDHDDLVLATALACWAGETPGVRPRPFSYAAGGEPRYRATKHGAGLELVQGSGRVAVDRPIEAFRRGGR